MSLIPTSSSSVSKSPLAQQPSSPPSSRKPASSASPPARNKSASSPTWTSPANSAPPPPRSSNRQPQRWPRGSEKRSWWKRRISANESSSKSASLFSAGQSRLLRG